MINSRKKGFTLVELVIVIAVIAILAAVLIPTFSNLIKKANVSADQQAVVQMNKALTMADAEKDVLILNDAIEVLSNAGYNANDKLVPITTGYSFFWYQTYNTIVLVNENTGKVEYPTNNKEVVESFNMSSEEVYNLEKCYSFIEKTATSAEDLSTAISNGNSVKLTADITLGEALTIPADKDVVINLGGKTLTLEKPESGSNTPYVQTYGNLKLENGTINARGVQAYSGGVLTIENGVTVNAVDSNGGAAVYCWPGGKVIINGGEFKAVNTENMLTGATALINKGDVIVNGGKFVSAPQGPYAVQNTGTGTLVLNKAEIISTRGGICSTNGNTVIESGVKVTLSENAEHYCIYAQGGTITVNGGQFTGGTYRYYVIESGEIILPGGGKAPLKGSN